MFLGQPKMRKSHLRCSQMVVFDGSYENLQIVLTPAFRHNGSFFLG